MTKDFQWDPENPLAPAEGEIDSANKALNDLWQMILEENSAFTNGALVDLVEYWKRRDGKQFRSYSSVRKYSYKYDWKARIQAQRAIYAEQAREAAQNDRVEAVKLVTKLYRYGLGMWIKKMEKGEPLGPTAMDHLERAARLLYESTHDAAPTQKHSIKGAGTSIDRLREIMEGEDE